MQPPKDLIRVFRRNYQLLQEYLFILNVWLNFRRIFLVASYGCTLSSEKHATQNYWEKMNVAIVALTMSETIGMIEAGIICAYYF